MSIHDHELPALAAFMSESQCLHAVAAGAYVEPFSTDCGEAWCSLIDPDIDNVVLECPHEAECKAAFASGRATL